MSEHLNNPVCNAQQLTRQMGSEIGVRIMDCRFSLADPDAGERAYREGHIPGAIYAHLDRDLAADVTAESGRHPLPDPVKFSERLGAWGVTPEVPVVAYDDAGGAFAARLWWLLRWVGHTNAAVLDGGWQAWVASGGPVSSVGAAAVEKSRWLAESTAVERAGAICDASELGQGVQEGSILVIDARAEERFSGRTESIDPVAGHIPGALNLPFAGNLGADGCFLPAIELRARFEPLLTGRSPASVVHMCGSGVTACHNLLAMEVAGLYGSRLYPGSWSEWIRDPRRPVAREG